MYWHVTIAGMARLLWRISGCDDARASFDSVVERAKSPFHKIAWGGFSFPRRHGRCQLEVPRPSAKLVFPRGYHTTPLETVGPNMGVSANREP